MWLIAMICLVKVYCSRVLLYNQPMVSSLPQVEQIRHRFLRWLALGILAWLLATLPLPIAAGLVGVTAGAILFLRWPWLLWIGLAVVLPVSSGIKFGPLSATDVGVAAGVALWFVDGVRRRTLRLELSPEVVAVLVYVGALLLALYGAQNLGEAVAEVLKWVEVAVVILLVRQMLPPDKRQWLVVALLIGGISQGLLGLYQFIFRIGPDWFIILGRFMRASGSFHQPNPYAGYLGLCFPVAASLAIWHWHHLWQARCQNLKSKIQDLGFVGWALFYTGATGVIAAGLLASWSRGGWLGAATTTVLMLTLHSRRSMVLGVSGALVLLFVFLLSNALPIWVPAPVLARFQDIPAYFGLTDVLSQPVTDENFAIIERLAHWVAAVRMWESAPWLGIGPGNYNTVYPMVSLPQWEEPLGHAHNIYLNTLAESGLIGFAAYLGLWIVVLLWVWRQRWSAVDKHTGWRAALAIGILGVVGHSLVHNFFDNLFVQGIYLQLAFWLALLGQRAAKGVDQEKLCVTPER
jgi:O-antigen ligase